MIIYHHENNHDYIVVLVWFVVINDSLSTRKNMDIAVDESCWSSIHDDPSKSFVIVPSYKNCRSYTRDHNSVGKKDCRWSVYDDLCKSFLIVLSYKIVYTYLYRYHRVILCVVVHVIFTIFQDTRERKFVTREYTDDGEISYSMGKVQHVVIFHMHDTNVYHDCDDYHIYFKIKMHIGVMCDSDIFQMILYTIDINCLTFIWHMMMVFMIYIFVFVICYICINIFIIRQKTTVQC